MSLPLVTFAFAAAFVVLCQSKKTCMPSSRSAVTYCKRCDDMQVNCIECTAGRWGRADPSTSTLDCLYECPAECAGSSAFIVKVAGDCDLFTGACKKCPFGFFGDRCASACAPECEGRGCSVDGRCLAISPKDECTGDCPDDAPFTNAELVCNRTSGTCVPNPAQLANCAKIDWRVSSRTDLVCVDRGCRNHTEGRKCQQKCSPLCAPDPNGGCWGDSGSYCAHGCSAMALPSTRQLRVGFVSCEAVGTPSDVTSVTIFAAVGGAALLLLLGALVCVVVRMRVRNALVQRTRETNVITSLHQPQIYVHVPAPIPAQNPELSFQTPEPSAPYMSMSTEK
jgi:hypothetical protein